MLPITPTGGSPAVSPTTSTTQPADTGAKDSASLFEKLLTSANDDQLTTDRAIQDLVTGKNSDVQQVVLQVAKSEMSFQLFMEVRNQLIESYNELMRMQF
jgi:flagellar hook-basal body complex protein FliE